MNTQLSFPLKRTFAVLGFLLLSFNLLQAANEKIYINEISGNEKWLEIYNAENVAVDLSGYTIQKIDEEGIPADWVIPAGTFITAKGFLSWTQGADANVTFTWGISAKKNVAFKIFDKNNTELDYFEVKIATLLSQDYHRTVGRRTDGANELILFANDGTRNASNNTGTQYIPPTSDKKIYINEISGNDKWIEVYNDEYSDIDLSGYVIQKLDEAGTASNWAIPAGATIPAKGFKVWSQGENEELTFIFGISPKKDVTIKLFDNIGAELSKLEVRLALFSEGKSRTVGRQTDGAEELVIFLNGGTAGASNSAGTVQTPTANPKKIYVNEISGNDKWIEIYNAEDAAVDLTGYSLQKIGTPATPNSVDNWFIPSGTTIQAKGFLYWARDVNEEVAFTWGISATQDVAFKIFDDNGAELDYFDVRMPALNSSGNAKTVGRETDGAEKLSIFLAGGTKGASNSGGINSIEQVAGNKLFAYVKSGIVYLPEEVQSVSLTSISGAIVVPERKISGQTLDLQHLPKGIYILKLSGYDKLVKVQKIVVE
ncbi:lamin tail domain-containing protein [Viscerimonas tarda]